MKATIGAEFSFQMKPTGEINNIKIPEQTLKALRDALPLKTAGQANFSEQGLKDLLLQSTPPTFPDGPLEPGKNWASKPTKHGHAARDRSSRTGSSRFRAPIPSRRSCCVIDMDTRVSLEPADNSTVKIRSQEGKGSLIFDTEQAASSAPAEPRRWTCRSRRMGQTATRPPKRPRR